MEAYVPFRPLNVGALGAETVVIVPDAPAQLVEQFGWSFWYRLGHALFAVYLILSKHTGLAANPDPVRLAGNQTNLHNGVPLCITDRSSLLNQQLKNTMTPQQIVGLAVRLFSIWLLFLALQVIGYGNEMNRQPGLGPTNIHYLISGLTILLAIFLWFFPMFVAHKLVPKTKFDNVLRVPAHEAVTVACIIFAIGIFLFKVLPAVAFYIPLLVVMVRDNQTIANYEEFHFMRVAPIVIQLAVAMLLAFKAHTVSRFLLIRERAQRNE